MRLVITGGPKTGKTTLALNYDHVFHTDDLIGEMEWSEASQHIADHWLNMPGPWCIEGVAAPRALRKWLAQTGIGRPCDEIIFMRLAHEPLTPGQTTMSKGLHTVWKQILPELQDRGVKITMW